MRRPVLAGCLLLAFGSVASSQSNSPDDGPSPIEILAGVTPPAQAPGVAGKTDAKTDPAKKPDTTKASASKVDHLAQCLRDWDAATHMTRQEWARTCRRVVSSRLQFLREQEDK